MVKSGYVTSSYHIFIWFSKTPVVFFRYLTTFLQNTVSFLRQLLSFPPKAIGNVNRHTLQIIGITVDIAKNPKVTVHFADNKLVTGGTGSS